MSTSSSWLTMTLSRTVCHHTPPRSLASSQPIASFCWLEDEEGLKMKNPIYQLDTSSSNNTPFGLLYLGSHQCYRSGILLSVCGGDASLSGAASRGGLVLCAAGAGRRRSAHRHADRNTEIRPHKGQGESLIIHHRFTGLRLCRCFTFRHCF